MATSYTFRPIITSGLILSLDAENLKSYVSGSNWYDLTSNNNDGILTNSPTFEFNGVASFIFNGVDDFVDTNFIPTIGTGDITYDVWFKTSTAQTGAIINVRSASAMQFVLALCGDSGVYGSNLFVYSYNNVFDRGAVTTETWIDNTWHHVVAVHTSETDYLYVDGVLRASVTTSPLNINNTTTLRIGALGDGVSEYPGWYFDGNISNVKVYNKALIESEVLQNYNAMKHRFDIPTPTIVTDGLVLYLDAGNTASYPGTGTTWYDLTTNGIDGTLISSPTFNSSNGGYLSFNGISQYVNISSIGPYLTNTSNFSYCTTLKFNGSVFTNRHFFSYGDVGSYPDDLTFFYNPGNIIALQINNLSDGNGVTTYGPNVWVHLTVVYDGTQVGNQNRMKFYIDGAQQTLTFDYTVPSTTSPNVYTRAWIGGYSSNNGNFLNFDTSVVTIYNKSLSDSEVLQNYNAIKNRY